MTQDTPRRFPIRVEPRYRAILRIFGVSEGNAFVDLGDELDARFGWSRITTPVANCAQGSIEGPWLALTALGMRPSLRHADVTFAVSPRGGVRVYFRGTVPECFVHATAIFVTVA